jgi:hypothetical protein
MFVARALMVSDPPGDFWSVFHPFLLVLCTSAEKALSRIIALFVEKW